jgi:hypothetical protein
MLTMMKQGTYIISVSVKLHVPAGNSPRLAERVANWGLRLAPATRAAVAASLLAVESARDSASLGTSSSPPTVLLTSVPSWEGQSLLFFLKL